jgi:hypothetical protein
MKCIKCGKPAVAEIWYLAWPAHSLGDYCQECIDFREKAAIIGVSIIVIVSVFLGVIVYYWG